MMFELFVDVDYLGIQRSKETPVGMLQNIEVELSWKIKKQKKIVLKAVD